MMHYQNVRAVYVPIKVIQIADLGYFSEVCYLYSPGLQTVLIRKKYRPETRTESKITAKYQRGTIITFFGKKGRHPCIPAW